MFVQRVGLPEPSSVSLGWGFAPPNPQHSGAKSPELSWTWLLLAYHLFPLPLLTSPPPTLLSVLCFSKVYHILSEFPRLFLSLLGTETVQADTDFSPLLGHVEAATT